MRPARTAESSEPGAAPPTAMSVDEVWGLKEDTIPTWVQNRDSILESLQEKLRLSSPLQYLQDKYPTPESQERYARVLWQVLPPLEIHPPFFGC